jgi:hypothetical protein
VIGLKTTVWSSAVVTVSFAAFGAGLVTVKTKLSDAVSVPSLAVTTTEYGLPWDADAERLPVIWPVTGSKLNPGGRPSTDIVSV